MYHLQVDLKEIAKPFGIPKLNKNTDCREVNKLTKRLTKQQIDNICNVLTSGYLEKRLIEGKDASKIDIEDFVVSYLGCTVVFECIAEDYDCMGYASDGIQPLCVCRNGRKEEVVFPKDTIVIDKYLTSPGQITKKRFTIGHEAGHIISNRMSGKVEAAYNHVGDIVLHSTEQLHRRFSCSETEANNIAASLLMPEYLVSLLMNKLNNNEKIVKYPDDFLDGCDRFKVSQMASYFEVSFQAMFIRLKDLGWLTDGEIETYVEDKILGDSHGM